MENSLCEFGTVERPSEPVCQYQKLPDCLTRLAVQPCRLLPVDPTKSRPPKALSIAVVSIVAVFTAAAFTVVYAREWRWASVLLRSVLPRSVLLPPVPTDLVITRQVIMALAPTSLACPYGYYYYPLYARCVPTPKWLQCGGHRKSGSKWPPLFRTI